MGVSDARRLRQLEAENGKLKLLLPEATLDNHALAGVAGVLPPCLVGLSELLLVEQEPERRRR